MFNFSNDGSIGSKMKAHFHNWMMVHDRSIVFDIVSAIAETWRKPIVYVAIAFVAIAAWEVVK